MRRLALLFVGGAVWLFLAAIPVLADGGPHVASINSGTTGINSDNCAGCHRAHTAQGAMLLVADEADICLTCHGATGTGATTDVESGIQYTLATSGQVRGGTVLGALRGGGFVEARIDSGNVYRVGYNRYSSGVVAGVSFNSKVPVRATGEAVTSAHLALTASGLTATGMAWGNGALNSGAGADVELTCASCHNPHGNGNYRILNPIPDPVDAPGSTTAAFAPAASPVAVSDAPLPSSGDTRNYTVIQQKGTEGTDSSYLLYASQVVSGTFAETAGDYFHRTVPWDPQVDYVAQRPSTAVANDAPNGKPSTFNGQINAWCATCHSRYITANISGGSAITYPSGYGPYNTDSGDAIFKYRHSNTNNKPCTTCHVAHGSNAQMTGVYSANEAYPGGAAAPVGDSRLLKVDNRGTCQACHDPTGTITPGTVSPSAAPAPVPYVP